MFRPVDAARIHKVVRLGLPREAGWIYFLHTEADLVLRAPVGTGQHFHHDDEADPVAEIAVPFDRRGFVHVIDADGDIARADYHIGFEYVLDRQGTLLERAPFGDAGRERVPIPREHVELVLDSLDEIAPDAYEDMCWCFEAIERTQTKWLVEFTNATGPHFVAFSSQHPLIGPDGLRSDAWTEDLTDAIVTWATVSDDEGDDDE